MFAFLLTRPHVVKIITTMMMAAQLLGWISLAQASDTPPTTLSIDALHTMHRALREFDRFLDHHPLLEDELRLNPALVSDDVYLKENPELHDFLNTNSNVLPGLKYYPHYFLYRALLRQADAPLRHSEIAKLKEVLEQQPSLALELAKKPEAIRDPSFLKTHDLLRDFFAQHPEIGKVFLPREALAAKNP